MDHVQVRKLFVPDGISHISSHVEIRFPHKSSRNEVIFFGQDMGELLMLKGGCESAKTRHCDLSLSYPLVMTRSFLLKMTNGP